MTTDKIKQLCERPQARLCFAVPGDTMIDTVRDDGRSACFGQTLEEVQARYPGARLMAVDEFCRSKAAAQDTQVLWSECSEETFLDMLGCLPPAVHNSLGFLVGEPYDHHALTGVPRYDAFIRKETNGDGWSEVRHYNSSRPMTKAEFREFCEAAKEHGFTVTK